MDFEKLHTNFKRMLADLPSDLMEGMLVYDTELAQANKEQLTKGKRSDESTISPKYSDKYAKSKAKQSSISNPTPDLKLTGEYYKSIFITHPTELTLQIESDRIEDGFPLNVHLEERYGEKILGVPEKELRKTGLKVINDQKQKILNELRR